MSAGLETLKEPLLKMARTEELAYVAGILDSEGSIRLSKRRKEYPIIEITNTDRNLVDPYLRVKKAQAQLAMAFQERKIKGRHLTKEEKALDETQFRLMSQLNRRGQVNGS